MTGRDDELARLRAENTRLVELLEAHGIVWQAPAPPSKSSAAPSLTTDEKVALFRRLFQGRDDVYPIRWENKAGKSGYAPACANEWRPGICEKPLWWAMSPCCRPESRCRNPSTNHAARQFHSGHAGPNLRVMSIWLLQLRTCVASRVISRNRMLVVLSPVLKVALHTNAGQHFQFLARVHCL